MMQHHSLFKNLPPLDRQTDRLLDKWQDGKMDKPIDGRKEMKMNKLYYSLWLLWNLIVIINELYLFMQICGKFPWYFLSKPPQICYENLGKKVQLMCWCSSAFSFFFLFWAVHYNVQYLRKFTLSRIPSHEITCFLAHWLGNFSTISFYQISSFLSLNTFQDSCNNKIMSVHPNSFMLPKK